MEWQRPTLDGMGEPLDLETDSIDSLDPYRFYTPAELAPLMGLTKTALRNFAKESGHYTVLPKNKLAIAQDQARKIHEFIKNRSKAATAEQADQASADPWAI